MGTMESFLFLIFMIFPLALFCFFTFFKIFFISTFSNHKNKIKKLPPPPGPSPTLLVLKNIVIFLVEYKKNACFNFETILQNLKRKYGPIFHLRLLAARSEIIICNHSLAHQALVEKSAIFSNRPQNHPNAHISISNSNGPIWSLLRRNLSSEVFSTSRIMQSYSELRQCVLSRLIERLVIRQKLSPEPIRVVDDLRFCVFSLLVTMCFGEDHKLSEDKIKEMETLQLVLLARHTWLNLFDFWRGVKKILLSKKLEDFNRARKAQENMFISLIRARRKAKGEGKSDDIGAVSYVDALIDLQLPNEKRALNDGEIVSLCGEFLNAGTDTISTTLEWIMANLVKYPEIQEKLYEEILRIVGKHAGSKPPSGSKFSLVEEKELEKMPYLKATVLEGLRRHPPGHFVLPHLVTEDVELDKKYTLPKNARVNFMLAEMSWDPMVWENPMEFRPDRFLSTNFASQLDIKGIKEMKMMPFGAGRRMCPGAQFALLNLEYFVANLICYFRWKAIDDGIGVDLSEKHTFTVVMKNPLRAHIIPRVDSA